jgi:predicted dinucleotide-binding enzyme
MQITILGHGNMGSAIGKNLEVAGNDVTYYTSKDEADTFGDIIILAVPYAALDSLVEKYGQQLAGKVVVDITNPVDFQTWDGLEVPSDSSAAQQLQKKLPDSHVLKAFNTNFAATLQNAVIGTDKTTVLVAGDSQEAKQILQSALSDSPLQVIDAGSLKRARELEATGFLEMTLAARKQISWNGGFAVIR